jgi:hypothetical protein
MPTFRIWQYGQSNMVWLNNTTPGSPVADTLLPMLQAIVDPTQAEATIAREYNQTGTCFSGHGSAFTNSTMALQADGFYGLATSVCLVRPAAPGSANFSDWAAWPLTNTGSSIVTYATNASATVKAETSCILAMHSEYDTVGYKNQGWAANDPRVVEFAWRRVIGALRAALGKTAASLPVLATVPVPYTPGGNDGFDTVHAAIRSLAADAGFNLHIVCGQTMDCTWDRDGPAGAYTWHANNDDLALLARRIAHGIARVMGPVWAPSAFRSRPAMGPRAIAAQRIDDTTVDVWVRHDGGAALRLPAAPALGWRVRYNGRDIGVAGVAVQPDQRRIRLTLAEPCPSFRLLTVEYGAGNTRLLPAGGIYDDAASFDPKAAAAGITGANRIDGALLRFARPLPVGLAAPTF